MLRANAGIQGWQGKPGRLPAEETLQFEKKNSSHRPDTGACPAHGCCNSPRGASPARHSGLQTAARGVRRVFCGGVLIFGQDVPAFFYLPFENDGTRKGHAVRAIADDGSLRDKMEDIFR